MRWRPQRSTRTDTLFPDTALCRSKAEIWSWSRARGLFAGVALDVAVLSSDDAANEAVYGMDTTPRMIFEDRAANAPSTAIVNFRDELEEAKIGRAHV